MPPIGATGLPPSRLPVPKPAGEPTKPGIGSGLYVADGAGLELCAPKVPTSFEIRNTSGAPVKAMDLRVSIKGRTTVRHAMQERKAADLRVSIKGSATVKHETRERKDGGVEVSYAAPMSGEYRISVSIGPTPVPGSPFRVSCQQPRPCEKLSKVDWGLGVAFVGERYLASVTVADQFGDLWTADAKLSANVMEGDTVLFPAEVKPGKRVGMYEVSFKPEISGVYGLALALEGGRQLRGSPFPLRAKTDETVATNCKMYGAGLTRAVAGQATSFTIQAVDGKNNARLLGGDVFEVEITGPENCAPKAEVTDNNNGTYTVQWSTGKAGDFLITAWLEDCEVGGCAKACSVQPADLCAESTSCEGEGLSRARAGVPATFKILGCDKFGNRQTAGGDDIRVQVSTAAGDRQASVPGTVMDMGRGVYKATYKVSTAGKHEVNVLAGGKSVAGSPFALEVAPGQIHAGACALTGPGVQSVQLGREMRLLVRLEDSFGNAIADPGALEAHNVQVAIAGPAETLVRRGPLQDGAYTFAYSTKTPGTYTITATAAGGHMDGSPATVTASIAEAHAPLCEVIGTPLRISTIAGEEADVAFVAKDAKGFQKSLGGDVFTVSWERAGDDEPATFGKVVDLGTGEYTAQFTATSAGAYSVSVKHQGSNIAGSPFPAEVLHTSIAADCSYVVQEGLEKAVSGQQATFRVRAMDRYLNLVKLPAKDLDAAGPKGFQAMLLGPSKTEQVVELVPNRASSGGCELTGSYVARSAGMHHLAVMYRGEHIKGSPWQVTVACAAACARKSALEGIPQHFIAGREECIVVAAHDAFGCATQGNDTVCLTLDHASEGPQKVDVKDCGNGTYKAVVRMDRAGLVSIHAEINGQPLGLPATLHVLPAELHSLLMVTPPAIDTIAGEPATVVVSSRDRFLNPMRHGGASLVAKLRTFKAAGAGEAPEEATMKAQDRGNGSYAVDCSLKQACDFEVTVHLAEHPETAVTCHGKCRAGATCPALCERPGAPAALAAGQSGSLMTWRFDRFGNRITSAAQEVPFLATGLGPGTLRSQIIEKGDGSLEIRYSSDKAGQYELAVKSPLDGEPLAGSPFSLTVTPGELSPAHCTAQLAHSGYCLTAGSQALICIQAKDRFGNNAENLEGYDVKVSAQGPAAVSFKREQTGGATHWANLQIAGMYLVHVTVNGHPLSGWPRTLHVTAAASEAAKCMLTGPCLAGHAKIGSPWELALHTFDKFGNARVSGAEDVTVDVEGPQGTEIRTASVQDRGNGWYSVVLQPDREGRWLLSPRVNGKAVKEAGFESHALFGQAAAQECAVLGSQQDAHCGSATQLQLVPAGPLAAHRTFLGSERVHAHVRGTSGAAARVAASLAEDRKSWRVPLYWFESGEHQVSLYMDGAQVGSGAVTICARPAAVSLAASHFEGPGLSHCIAGERAEFIIQAKDAQGHLVTKGEAPFAVRACCGDEEVAGDVVEEGEGVSWVTYTLNTAGPVMLEAILPEAAGVRSFKAVCAPNGMSLAHSALASQPADTPAGEACCLIITQHDRYGNPSKTQLSELELEVSAEGPGPVEHSWHHAGDHDLCLQLSAKLAGLYSIHVLDTRSQDRLSGGPFTYTVTPGQPVACRSGAKFGKSLSKEGIVMAGAPLEVTVAVKDTHGNISPAETLVEVTALGPEEGPFEKLAAREFAAPLRLAGTYVVQASLDGVLLPGWPKQVTVVATREGPSGCAISGSALGGVFCGQHFQLTLTVTDCFSNSRTSGGDKVEAFLCGPDEAVLPVGVKDLGNGSYVLTTAATRPGGWTIKPRVNGEAVETAHRQLSASYGPVTAADCVLTWVGEAELACGASQKLTVQPKHLQYGCRMTGSETVILTMVTPKGVSLVQALAFRQAEGLYEAAISSLEVGTHTLRATLENEEIGGCPLSLEIVPGMPCLGASTFNESALASVVAGQMCTVLLHACNPFGTRLSSGGARLTAALSIDGGWHAAEVADRGDGSYAVSLQPEKAGSFQLVLSIEGVPKSCTHKRAYTGVCVAGVTAAEKCGLSGSMTQLVAGQPGKLTLTRADRFGNPVTRSEKQAPFALNSSGPGPVKHAFKEAANGIVDLGICATIVGTYSLSVSCGSDKAVVPGSQLSVHCIAAPASHAHCMAEMVTPAKGSILEAGKHAELAVTVYDSFGNITSDLAGHAIKATAHGPATVQFVQSPDGVHRAELTQAGSYAVHVGMQGHMLPSWPQALHVQPCASDASQCWFSGAVLQGVTCGELATVVLHTVDRFGNPRVCGGEQVAAQVQGGPSRGVPSTVKAIVTDNCDGTYALQFTLPLAGDWALTASVAGTEVPWRAAAQLKAEWAPLAARDCEISGVDGVVACGTSDPIFIQAVGGRTLTGHEAFSAVVSAPDGAVSPVPVILAEGGAHYQASLQWLLTGIHKVTVYLDGHPIPSTPFGVKVGPATLHAPACAVKGLAETCPFGMLEFEVHGRDAFGNSLQLLPRMLEVYAEPEKALEDVAMAQWEEASVITVRGKIKSAGALHVLVDGKPVIPGAHRLALTNPERCQLAFAAPHVQCRAGEQHCALVRLLDSKGFQLQAGGAVMHASMAAKDGQQGGDVAVQIKDRGTGLYELQLTLTQAGEYTLAAWTQGAESARAEASVLCKPGRTSPLHCRSDMTGLATWRAGQLGRLAIIRKDRHRNPVTDTEGEASLGVSITGAGPAHAELREADGGVTEVLCTARTAGDYVLSVYDLLSGAALFGSPYKVQLTPGAMTAITSWFRVTGSTEDADPCMCAGQEVEIALAARDGYVNAVGDLEPNAVKATAMGPDAVVKFEPYEASNSGMQHYLRAVFSKAGCYALSVAVTDPVTAEAVQIPPHSASERLVILPGTLAAERTQISNVPSTLIAGASKDIIVTPYDSFGNPGASGGRFAAELVLEDDESAPSIPCQVTESTTGGRSAIVSLQARAAGSYRLRVLMYPQSSLHKENALPDTVGESLIRVVEAGASSAHSWLGSFWPPQGAVAGLPAGLLIQACDEFSNERRQGGYAFKASIRGLDTDAVSVQDRGDGSYVLRYCLPSEGTFSLSVTGLDGKHLRGSPATLTAFRDVTALAEAELQRKLSASVADLRRGLSAARGLHAALRAEAAALEGFIPIIVEGAKLGMQQALAKQDLVLAESKAALAREAAARRKLHNLVQELRGNIRVFVRVRPADARSKGAPVLTVEDDQRIACTAAGATKAFEFDRVFGPESTQEQVFGDIAQLVTSALDGYNVCIFAYGQTGAGKTYTMEGTQGNPGINYRTMKELFRCIDDERADDATYEISASIVEIYNEQVWDLLAPGGKQELEVVKSIGGFDIPDLTQIAVTSLEQILGIMERGFEHRKTGCHDINAHSSRSHCALIVHAASTDAATCVRSVGKLTLCDLAGSERINKTGATGLTLTEAQNINRSLLELGNVISALMQQSPHVPYRNSKLTMLLQDSLGGNAKALMIANLAPSPAHATETLSSLAFASKVANVVLKTPQRRLEEGGNASATKPGTAAAVSRACADAKRSAAVPAPRARPSMPLAAERGTSKPRAFQ